MSDKATEVKIPFNRAIDMSIEGEWYCYAPVAKEYLFGYLHDLSLLTSKAVTLSELGYDKARAEQRQSKFLPIKNSKLKIQEFKLEGAMMSQDTMSHYGVGQLISKLRTSMNDSTVAVGLLEVESGGGQMLAAQKLQNAIQDYNKVKPLYVLVHLAASAAFKAILSSSDRTYLSGGNAVTGSIGAMMEVSKGLVEKYKKDTIALYSKNSPDKNKETRALANDNFEPYITYLTKLDIVFENEVREAIPNITEKALKGGIFVGKEALKHNLAKGIKTKQELLSQIEIDFSNKFNKDNTNMNFPISFDTVKKFAIKMGWSVEATDAIKDEATLTSQLDATESLSVQIAAAVAAAVTPFKSEITTLKGEITALKAGTSAKEVVAEKREEDMTALMAKMADNMGVMSEALAALNTKATANKEEIKSVADAAAVKIGDDAPVKVNTPAPELKAAEMAFEEAFEQEVS